MATRHAETSITPEQLLTRAGVEKDLGDKECSDDHILEISCFLEKWELVVSHLGLENPHIEEVKHNSCDDIKLIRLNALRKWKSLFAFKATYRELLQALLKSGSTNHAVRVCNLLVVTNRLSMPTLDPSEPESASTGQHLVQLSLPNVLPTQSSQAITSIGSDNRGACLVPRSSTSCEGRTSVAAQVKTFEGRFHDLRMAAQTELIRKEVTVEALRLTLITLPAGLSQEHDKYLKSNFHHFERAKSLGRIFLHFNTYLSFIDFSLLEHIIEHLCSDELQQEMNQYSEDMRLFREETMVCDLIPFLPRASTTPKYYSDLVIKVDVDITKCTLEDLDQYRKLFLSEFLLSKLALHLATVENGSLLLHWLIPSDIISALKSHICKQDVSFFQRLQILKFTIKEHLYPLPDQKEVSPAEELKEKLQQTDSDTQKALRSKKKEENFESDIARYMAQQKEQTLKISQLESQLAELEKEKQLNHTEKENLETKIEKLTSLNELENGQINTKERHLSESKQELDLTTELLEKEKAEAKELKKRLQQKDSDTQKALNRLVRDRDQAWQDLTSGGQFHLLHGRALLKWEHVQQQESIPMTAPQCTIIDSTLYFGGGQTDNDKVAERKQVFAFDTNASISDNPIYKVPDCPVIHFGLGNIGGKLVAVGGRNPDNKDLTNEVHVLDKNQQGALEWNRGIIPGLSKPRARACIVSQTEDQTSTCIAACGGRIQNQDYEASSNIVEVYRKDSPRWDKVAPLPHPRAALRVTVLHNTAYLLGGFFDDMKGAGEPDCQSIVLDNLFQKKPREQGGWRVLKHMPSRSATPGHLCGTLLAVGGLMDGNKKSILAFNPNTQMWVHIANLPKTISSATAAALPNGKLIIFGGWETKECRNREIFIGRVTGRMF